MVFTSIAIFRMVLCTRDTLASLSSDKFIHTWCFFIYILTFGRCCHRPILFFFGNSNLIKIHFVAQHILIKVHKIFFVDKESTKFSRSFSWNLQMILHSLFFSVLLIIYYYFLWIPKWQPTTSLKVIEDKNYRSFLCQIQKLIANG